MLARMRRFRRRLIKPAPIREFYASTFTVPIAAGCDVTSGRDRLVRLDREIGVS